MPLIHLQLMFGQADKSEPNCTLLYEDIQFPSTPCRGCCLSSNACVWLFVKYQKVILTSCAHVCIVCFALLVYMSVFAPIQYCFYYYSSIIYPKMWNSNPTYMVLFAQDCLAIQHLLRFHMCLGFLKIIFVKKCCVCVGWNCIVSLSLILVG